MSEDVWIRIKAEDLASQVAKSVIENIESKTKSLGDTSEKMGSQASKGFDLLHSGGIKAIHSIENAVKAMGGLILKVGGLVLAATGLAGAFSFKKAIEESGEFETALVDVAKVSSESLAEVRKKILDLPPELGSATNLMKGYYQTISAGVTEPLAAMDLMTTAAKASNAAHVDQSLTIQGLTKMMAGFEGEIKSATEASDLLFAIEKEGQTTFAEMIPIIGGVSKISHDLGITSKEMGGALATITQTAGSTAEAATEYKAILMALMQPTKEMSAELKIMGYDSAQAAIADIGLAKTLELLKESTEGSAEKMAKLFGRQEALIGISALSANNFETLTKKTEEMGKSAGATESAFGRWTGTWEGIKEAAKNSIGEQLILIGEKLAPHIKNIVELFGGWLEKNKDMIAQEVGGWIDKVATAAEKLWPFIKGIAEQIGIWYQDLKKLIDTKWEQWIKDFEKWCKQLKNDLPAMVKSLSDTFTMITNVLGAISKAYNWVAEKIQNTIIYIMDAQAAYERYQQTVNTKTESVTKFTGENSTVKPLSEKIEEMEGKIEDFSSLVDSQNPELRIDATPSSQKIELLIIETGDFASYVENTTPELAIDITPSRQALANLREDYTNTIASLMKAQSAAITEQIQYGKNFGPSASYYQQQIGYATYSQAVMTQAYGLSLIHI